MKPVLECKQAPQHIHRITAAARNSGQHWMPVYSKIEDSVSAGQYKRIAR
jgi:hypothetical protein